MLYCRRADTFIVCLCMCPSDVSVLRALCRAWHLSVPVRGALNVLWVTWRFQRRVNLWFVPVRKRFRIVPALFHSNGVSTHKHGYLPDATPCWPWPLTANKSTLAWNFIRYKSVLNFALTRSRGPLKPEIRELFRNVVFASRDACECTLRNVPVVIAECCHIP